MEAASNSTLEFCNGKAVNLGMSFLLPFVGCNCNTEAAFHLVLPKSRAARDKRYYETKGREKRQEKAVAKAEYARLRRRLLRRGYSDSNLGVRRSRRLDEA